MDFDTLLGCSAIAFSLSVLFAFVWWARNAINRINNQGPATAREILRGDRESN